MNDYLKKYLTNKNLFDIDVMGIQITLTHATRYIKPLVEERVTVNLDWAMHEIKHLIPSIIFGHNHITEGIKINDVVL
jgi:hypothetical protein